MSTTRIQFTTTLFDDKLVVEATILTTLINRFVFYYKNTGTTELGPFQGVVDVEQLTRIPAWTGSAVPVVAVPYVRHDVATRTLSSMDEVTAWIDTIHLDVASLVRKIASTAPVVATYDIVT